MQIHANAAQAHTLIEKQTKALNKEQLTLVAAEAAGISDCSCGLLPSCPQSNAWAGCSRLDSNECLGGSPGQHCSLHIGEVGCRRLNKCVSCILGASANASVARCCSCRRGQLYSPLWSCFTDCYFLVADFPPTALEVREVRARGRLEYFCVYQRR